MSEFGEVPEMLDERELKRRAGSRSYIEVSVSRLMLHLGEDASRLSHQIGMCRLCHPPGKHRAQPVTGTAHTSLVKYRHLVMD